MKYKILLSLLLISSVTFSQNFRGTWKGKVQGSDSIIHVNLNVMIQNDTLVRAILLSPTFCMLTDSCFYGLNLHLKSTEIKIKLKGEIAGNRNQLKKEPKTQYQEIKFSGTLAQNKNQLNGMLTLNGKVTQLNCFVATHPSIVPRNRNCPIPIIRKMLNL